jgi:hypothetical protein
VLLLVAGLGVSAATTVLPLVPEVPELLVEVPPPLVVGLGVPVDVKVELVVALLGVDAVSLLEDVAYLPCLCRRAVPLFVVGLGVLAAVVALLLVVEALSLAEVDA